MKCILLRQQRNENSKTKHIIKTSNFKKIQNDYKNLYLLLMEKTNQSQNALETLEQTNIIKTFKNFPSGKPPMQSPETDGKNFGRRMIMNKYWSFIQARRVYLTELNVLKNTIHFIA